MNVCCECGRTAGHKFDCSRNPDAFATLLREHGSVRMSYAPCQTQVDFLVWNDVTKVARTYRDVKNVEEAMEKYSEWLSQGTYELSAARIGDGEYRVLSRTVKVDVKMVRDVRVTV